MQIVCKFSKSCTQTIKSFWALEKPRKVASTPSKSESHSTEFKNIFHWDLTFLPPILIAFKRARYEKNSKYLKTKSPIGKTKEIIHQMDPFSFDEFKSKLFEKNEIKVADVYTLFDRRINKLNEEGKVSTGRTYRDARNSMKKFKSRLKFADVTPDFLNKYESHMISKGRSFTTISIYVRHLRTIFNQAIDDDVIDRKHYPFGKNKYQPKAPRNIKKALTVTQIKSIIGYDVAEGTNQQLAKDMWLLS